MVENNKQIVQHGFWHIDLQEFVCGWGASFINIAVTYPVYKIMFRQVKQKNDCGKSISKCHILFDTQFRFFFSQMLHGVEMKSAVNELRHEGFAFLYRGILPPLAQRTVSLSLMFGLYDGTKRPLVKLGANEYVAKVVAGMTAGGQ